MKKNSNTPLPSLRQNRISFATDSLDEAKEKQGIRTLRIERIFPDRGTGWIDLAVLAERASLAQSLMIGVQQVVDTCGSPSSMRSYQDTLIALVRVMKIREDSGGSPIKKLSDITVPVLQELSDGLLSLTNNTTTGYQRSSQVKRILLEIENVNPGTYNKTLLKNLCLGSGEHIPNKAEHKQPYTDYELHQIEKACRNDIKKTIRRLTTEAAELRRNGQDPRESGWTGMANAVWYLENVGGGKYISSREIRKLSRRHWWITTNAFKTIYPDLEDMIPFYLFICIKTGLNPESVMRLKRNCLDDKTLKAHETLLHYVKLRSSGPMVMPVRTDGTFSPGGLIRTYLMLSRKCSELAGNNSLWLVAKPKLKNFVSAPAPVTFARGVCDFAKRHNLKDDNGAPLQLRADRLRTTRKTLNYRHSNGDLQLAGHDHRRDSTTVEYINNRLTEDVHNQAIMNGQHQFHSYFSGFVIPDGVSVADASKIIGTDAATTEAIINGKQEMLIADCKDMFNAPGGRPGELCGKVWACFGCQNSIWTSRILPKVLWYMDFFLEQRRMLSEYEWEKKFGYPYTLITSHILPAFTEEAIELAKIAAKELHTYVPPEMRTY